MTRTNYAKKVKIRCTEMDTSLAGISKAIGYSTPTVAAVVGGRYRSKNLEKIVKKINAYLGITGYPELAPNTPSKDWALAVKVELAKREMTLRDLSKTLEIPESYLSQMMNFRCLNEAYVAKINRYLGIKLNPAA